LKSAESPRFAWGLTLVVLPDFLASCIAVLSAIAAALSLGIVEDTSAAVVAEAPDNSPVPAPTS
jgi:hypothetical protein